MRQGNKSLSYSCHFRLPWAQCDGKMDPDDMVTSTPGLSPWVGRLSLQPRRPPRRITRAAIYAYNNKSGDLCPTTRAATYAQQQERRPLHTTTSAVTSSDGRTDRPTVPTSAVSGAGFEEQHRDIGVLSQAVCQHTARRACASDDVVKQPPLQPPSCAAQRRCRAKSSDRPCGRRCRISRCTHSVVV